MNCLLVGECFWGSLFEAIFVINGENSVLGNLLTPDVDGLMCCPLYMRKCISMPLFGCLGAERITLLYLACIPL